MQGKVSIHARKRVNERVETNMSPKALARYVSENGKDKNMYVGKFHQYLESKESKGAKAKVYRNNLYILSKNTKRLITVYAIPDKYLPVEQYQKNIDIDSLKMFLLKYTGKYVIIEFKNNETIKGYVLENNELDNMPDLYIKCDDEIKIINISDIENIDYDFMKYVAI